MSLSPELLGLVWLWHAQKQSKPSEPLRATGTVRRFDARITVEGGGSGSQIDTIKLGLARALVRLDVDNRTKLKPAGLLTRDPREVESKKASLKKARRAPQFSKR